MRLLKAFFHAVNSAAKSATVVAETVATTATKVAKPVTKVLTKVAKTALQLSIILAVGSAAMLILLMILPMILTNTIDIEQEHSQAIELLPPSKSKPSKQQEIIENGVLITPLSDEDLLIYSFFQEPLESTTAEVQEAAKTDRTPAERNIKPLNNQLVLTTICWQAINKVAEQLNKIKASELKSIASELQIPKYRNMNKSQLMISIIKAQEEAPEFSC